MKGEEPAITLFPDQYMIKKHLKIYEKLTNVTIVPKTKPKQKV